MTDDEPTENPVIFWLRKRAYWVALALLRFASWRTDYHYVSRLTWNPPPQDDRPQVIGEALLAYPDGRVFFAPDLAAHYAEDDKTRTE